MVIGNLWCTTTADVYEVTEHIPAILIGCLRAINWLVNVCLWSALYSEVKAISLTVS